MPFEDIDNKKNKFALTTSTTDCRITYNPLICGYFF